ncbi:MAG: EamA/RhaT family transporter, partial [Alphaproteobacteria bacterium]|nr:EamA/RhaT family transporter [Alphaproteobacteria bacterium]
MRVGTPDPDAAAPDQPLAGLIARLFAVMMLAMMTTFIRVLALRHVGLIESMFYRNLFAAPLILAYISLTKGVGSI